MIKVKRERDRMEKDWSGRRNRSPKSRKRMRNAYFDYSEEYRSNPWNRMEDYGEDLIL